MLRIEVLETKHAEHAARVLISAFENDPYSLRAASQPVEHFRSWMKDTYLPKVIAKKGTCSFVAVSDEPEGRVLGVLTLEDFMDSDKHLAGLVTSDPRLAILGKGHDIFWEELAKRKALTKETSGRVCYYGFIGVDQDYRRMKVGDALMRRGMEQAPEMGYAIGVAFTTSPRSTSLFTKLGFQKWGEIVYREFVLPTDGSKPFESKPDSMSIMVRMFG